MTFSRAHSRSTNKQAACFHRNRVIPGRLSVRSPERQRRKHGCLFWSPCCLRWWWAMSWSRGRVVFMSWSAKNLFTPQSGFCSMWLSEFYQEYTFLPFLFYILFILSEPCWESSLFIFKNTKKIIINKTEIFKGAKESKNTPCSIVYFHRCTILKTMSKCMKPNSGLLIDAKIKT